MRELFKVNEKNQIILVKNISCYFIQASPPILVDVQKEAKLRRYTSLIRRTISSVCNVLYYFENSGCAIKISFRGDKIKKEIVTSR